MNHHLTAIELNEYVDSVSRAGTRTSKVERHLQECEECRARYESIWATANAFRRLPLEHVSPNFTERVMEQLGINEASPIAWSVMKNIAPIVALVLVTGIVYVVLKLTGSFEATGVGQSITATQSVYNSVSNRISTSISTFNSWMKTLLPFLYAKSSYGMTVLLLVLFGVVAIVDRYIFAPMLRRRLW